MVEASIHMFCFAAFLLVAHRFCFARGSRRPVVKSRKEFDPGLLARTRAEWQKLPAMAMDAEMTFSCGSKKVTREIVFKCPVCGKHIPPVRLRGRCTAFGKDVWTIDAMGVCDCKCFVPFHGRVRRTQDGILTEWMDGSGLFRADASALRKEPALLWVFPQRVLRGISQLAKKMGNR